MAKTVYLLNAFSSGELSPKFDGRTDLDFYRDGCKTLKNMSVYPQGGVTKRPGTYFYGEAGDSDNPVRLIEFIYNDTGDAHILEFGHQYMRVFVNDGQIYTVSGESGYHIGQVPENGTAYEISTPYLGSELFDIKFAQVVDQIYLTHPSHKPQVLTRYDYHDWDMSDLDAYGGPFLDENTYRTQNIWASAISGTVFLNSDFSYFNSSMIDGFLKIRGDEVQEATIDGEDQWTGIIQLDNGESLTAQTTGSWAGTATLEKSWDLGSTWTTLYSWSTNDNVYVTETEDEVYYRLGIASGDYTSGECEARLVERNKSGWAEIYGVSGTQTAYATVESNFSTDATTSGDSYKWSEGSWSDWNGYPAAICFAKQRTIMANTAFEPTTFWGSQIDDYVNFDEGTGLDDEAFAFTIASNDVNPIRSLVDFRILMAFTAAGVWKLSPVDEGVTPSNPQVSKQSSFGANKLQPIIIGNSIMYIQSGSHKLRRIVYDFQTDSWLSDELSMKADHLLRDGRVVDWTFAEKPDSTIYMVMSTGDAVTCTYDLRNKIVAFAQLTTTSGSFESFSSIPGTDRDEVWAVVNRTIGGQTKRYIEKFTSPFWTDQDEYIYMDSALTYEGTPKTTLSGLSHLEGQSLTVLVDGAVHPNCTVVSGVITLQDGYEGVGPTAVVHAGLGYSSVLQTMRLNEPTSIGPSLGKQQCTYDITAILQDTINWKLGIDEDNVITQKSLNYPSLSEAVEPFTGAINKIFDYGYDDELYITIVSDTPTPITINSIAATVVAADR